MARHPLDDLSVEETNTARDLVNSSLAEGEIAKFRAIALREPEKAQLAPFLALEHQGLLTEASNRPPRLALAQYAVFASGRRRETEAVIDLDKRVIAEASILSDDNQPAHCGWEMKEVIDIVKESPLFKRRISELSLDPKFDIVVEPWPYGGQEDSEDKSRYMQAMVFGFDTTTKNADSNHYAFPIPIIPVVAVDEKRVVRIEELSTFSDEAADSKPATNIIGNCEPSEYIPELLPGGAREDLKTINITQPDGPSFTIEGQLVKWQKWSFRVGFNPREGAVIHDVWYDGRSILYRLSMSEMTVPYADPRGSYYRKQAFDFGDGTMKDTANSLKLGCDCLGLIKYFDTVVTELDGTGTIKSSVICMHEQDDGIGWKHTNWRTGRPVVSRRRELIIQFIITLANYEYIFIYKFDQAGAITVEIRATGIVSVVNIDPSETSSPFGTIVAPGALAQNHQHLFNIRIDPAVDGSRNTVVQSESLPLPAHPKTNPHGNLYEVRETRLQTSTFADTAPQNGRVFKIQNLDKRNAITGKPVGYKIVLPATQMMLADPCHIQSTRAKFAHHPLWVTQYRDGELYAGGKYPMQSAVERGGVADAAARGDNIVQDDIVVWAGLGLTHNPRIEDWPVMPVETLQLHILPHDFFTANPAIDVPSKSNGCSRQA